MPNKMWCLAQEEIWTAFFKKVFFRELQENDGKGIPEKRASEIGFFLFQYNYFMA